MKQIAVSMMVVFMAVSLCAQAAAPTDSSPNSSDSNIRGPVPTTLVKSLDSKKLKEGDIVVCQTTAALHAPNGVLIPSGAKVIGHVTQAEARSKGNANSTLAITFDKVEVAKGKEYAMKGTVQALGPTLGESGPSTGPATPGSLSGAGASSAGSGSTTEAPTSSMQIAGPVSGTPVLIPSSKGVMGLKNLTLGENGLITSPNKEVKLDNGIQVLILSEISGPAR